MRYIQKREEPGSLTQYRKMSYAYFDGYAEKDDVRASLLKEQGYLCGYCMRRLKMADGVKIEHIIPQSSLMDNEKEALNYKIMLGVCHGNERKGRTLKLLTCDAHRQNRDLKINPFDNSSINKVEYKSDGVIYSKDVAINMDLDETLNLNYDGADAYLVKNRREVLDACKAKIRKMQAEGTWTRPLLEKVLREYEEPDETGMLKSYSGIAVWYLKKRLKRG